MANTSATSGSLVIGTAGHVDHGKTSLVRALTGVDLDRLPEEKERGITIALGFTPLRLPDGRIAGLVDVPGHEALVRTMVAGASGMDAVMLCVSAVEGVMPQTREHLDILHLLGVHTGVLVLTMADLVDAELLELCEAELREHAAGTFLANAPCVATSAMTGVGLPALVAALGALVPPARPTDPAFRLPVDRSFARRGFGTVVTGTAWSGRLNDGAEVEIVPGGRRARVRGVQVHGAAVPAVEAGARTALNLAGVERDEVGRGAWIATPGSLPSPLVVDCRYTHLPSAPSFDDDPRLVVLLGTREVEARVVPLDAEGLAPGWSGFVQLRAGEPLPCVPGDRFVVRRPSPAATVGGGVVLDPWATVTRRRDAASNAAQLARLHGGDPSAWLDRAGAAGLTAEQARVRGVPDGGVPLGDRRYAPALVGALREALHAAVARVHAEQPLTPWINRKSLREGRLFALAERDALALVDAEVAAGRLVADGPRVRARDFEVRLSAEDEAWRRDAIARIAAAGLEGVGDLRERTPHARFDALVFLMRERGEVDAVGDRLVARSTLDRLAADVRAHLEVHAELDTGAFKDLSGQTRRTAIPLLEWLDAAGVTKRRGDVRVRA